MELFFDLLLIFLLVCAVAVSLSKNLLNSIIVYMSFSLIMSVIWILLESPDLAITEAAVGAGVTSILFIITLKKIHEIVKDKAKVLEDNYYLIGERYIRLFDRAQFDQFFGQFNTLSLEEIHTVRFKNQRDHWEFIFQKD